MNGTIHALGATILASGLLIGAPAAPATVTKPDLPQKTVEGKFDGTWFYTDPGFDIAIFIWHDETGLLRIRYHVKHKTGLEYETDKGGYAKVLEAGNTLEVLFTGSPNAAGDVIEGHHERIITERSGGIHESGDFQLYRAEAGHKLVLYYPEYRIEQTGPDGRTKASGRTDVVTLFRKASEIVLDFGEIPF